MNIDEFVKNVQKWSEIRGLHKGDPRSQYLKVVEEVGEIASGLARDNIELTKDGIGDVFVTLIILAQKLGVNIEDCTDMAWNDIKDRNGMMVNDVFIKEADFTEIQKLQFAEKQGGFKINPDFCDSESEIDQRTRNEAITPVRCDHPYVFSSREGARCYDCGEVVE